MKRLIKYPLAVLFALLMGYSQVFAYLQAPGSSSQNPGGIERIHQAHGGSLAFESAIVGEIEEDEVDRSSLHVDGSASPLLQQIHIEPFKIPAPFFNSYPHLSSFPDTYLRFRAIRL